MEKPARLNGALRKVTWAAVFVGLLALLWLTRSLPLKELAGGFQGMMDSLGIIAPLVFGLVYVIATVLFVPGLIFSLAGGAFFGLLMGTVTVSLASTTGAAIAFLIARYAARDRIRQLAASRPRFGAIDRAIGEGGWKIVALLRLSPAVPFNVQNYLYGLTPIRFGPYVVTSWLAMLPGTFMYVYIGHITGMAVAGGRDRTWYEWVALAVGLLATVAATLYVTYLAKRKLQEQVGLEADGGEGTERTDGTKPVSTTRRVVTTAAALGAAFLLVVAAGYVHYHPHAPRQALAGILGPPAVTLQQAYEEKPEGPTMDHGAFTDLLRKYVDAEGFVDYKGLASEQEKLDSYLEAIANAPYDAMGRSEKLALLINAYNAFTLKLILENYPLTSIKDIPSDKRWDAVRWNVGDHTWSLNQIEHQQIRPKFKEPRIHFAVVCAAVGCPPLRNQAYVANRLDEQLEKQAEFVHSRGRWFQFAPDGNVVHLTALYKWYAGDFEQTAGSVLEYAARYAPKLREALNSGAELSVEWLDYNWSLNSQANKADE